MTEKQMKNTMNQKIQIDKNGFLSLCYHYVRSKDAQKEFPKILGNSVDEFKNHIEMLKSNYKIISLSDIEKFILKNQNLNDAKYSILITFDDGLSDHFEAAKILHENNINAIFFIPSCIFKDNLPANPMIIHYSLAIFGIEKFLDEYRIAIQKNGLELKKYDIKFFKNIDDIWETIRKIKFNFKYIFDNELSRKILLMIYERLILKKFPDAMKKIHLTESQVSKMLKMGHSIGTHTHSHISIAGNKISLSDFKKEVLWPKQYLEDLFDTKISSFSYPFGEKKDCLSTRDLISKTNDYQLAFTVDEIFNTKLNSPYELGRYQPQSNDNAKKLGQILHQMVVN